MTVATVSASGQADIAVAMIVVITFATVVVLWVHERRWDRHEAELAVHHEQLATLAGRLQSIADFLQVDVHDARDDSPAALADADTEEFPIAPPTVPDGIPLAVQSALLGKSAEWVEVEIAALRARNAERMARAAVTKEAS
jgi:hypothetical protein